MNALIQRNTTYMGLSFFKVVILFALLCFSSLSSASYKVKVVYMNPSDRFIQINAETELRDYLLRIRAWMAEEMARLGYGSKTFNYETEADGVTPKINFVDVTENAAWFQSTDYLTQWFRILDALDYAGFPAWQEGEVLLVVANTQSQNLDGSWRGSFVGGTEWNFSGVGIVTGEYLARFPSARLTDNTPYNGLILDWLGDVRLIQDTSFPWFEGTTVSSISSSAQGAALHELLHAMGAAAHDMRNDSNFRGNAMGNGLRGIRGSLYPNLYPSNDTFLSKAQAMQLNVSPFLNNRTSILSNPPLVNITSPDTITPSRGLCPISFSATDDNGLAGALLLRDGDVVAEMPLTGVAVNTTLRANDYVPGQNHSWSVLVFDIEGNQTLHPEVSLRCAPGYNRAAQPFVTVSKRSLRVGESVVLSAQQSLDPDGNNSNMTVRWDKNSDGVYETSASRTKTYTTSYSVPGVYRITARLTDERGDRSMSAPIGVRVR
jgi:hypothetical protein